jgi:putative transposase
VFFGAADYRRYLELVSYYAGEAGTEIWAYCLMPNHVHLMLVPGDEQGLHNALQEAHRRYTRHINIQKGWKGYLWQGRFASCPMDERHTLAAARYVELNPVRAGLTRQAGAWPWSSARAHLAGEDDGVVRVAPLLAAAPDWAEFLAQGLTDDDAAALRKGERTGRPVGSQAFLKDLETCTGRTLQKGRPGPKIPASAR